MNTCIHAFVCSSVFDSFGCILRSRIDGSCDNSMSKFFEEYFVPLFEAVFKAQGGDIDYGLIHSINN